VRCRFFERATNAGHVSHGLAAAPQWLIERVLILLYRKWRYDRIMMRGFVDVW